jgi:hypothetical protein
MRRNKRVEDKTKEIRFVPAEVLSFLSVHLELVMWDFGGLGMRLKVEIINTQFM